MTEVRRSADGYGVIAACCLWLGLCLAAASGAMASSPFDTVPTLDVVRSRLELTPEQDAKLTPVFQRRASELQEASDRLARAATPQEEKAVIEVAKQQGQAFNTEVESALTPTQKTKWRELRKETREKLKDKYEEKRAQQ